MSDFETCTSCGTQFLPIHEGFICLACGADASDDEDEDLDDRYDDRDGVEDDDLIDGVGFADPGGRSALRCATPRNPRNLPCPTCEQPNRLTPADAARGYQCDACADRDEGRGCW